MNHAESGASGPEGSSLDAEVAEASAGEPRPIFGRGAGPALILPLLVFLLGLTIGGWLDTRSIASGLTTERQRVEQSLGRALARTPDSGYGVEELATALARHPGSASRLASASALIREAPTAAPREIQELGREVETYLVILSTRVNDRYPRTYTLVLCLTLLAVLVASPVLRRAPGGVSAQAWVVGIVGVVVWIGLWWIDQRFLGIARLAGFERQGFDPFAALAGRPGWMWGFFAIRFVGLIALVPLLEEFFLRGFLMRYVDAIRWDHHPLGVASWVSVSAVLFYAVVTHPSVPLAALAFFGLVTWMYLRTRSIWDCIVAHMVTNTLLVIFVLMTGTWALW